MARFRAWRSTNQIKEVQGRVCLLWFYTTQRNYSTEGHKYLPVLFDKVVRRLAVIRSAPSKIHGYDGDIIGRLGTNLLTFTGVWICCHYAQTSSDHFPSITENTSIITDFDSLNKYLPFWTITPTCRPLHFKEPYFEKQIQTWT